MKKRIATFIITLALIVLASMLDFAPLTTRATNGKKAENQPLYIITAMYNGELEPLDCWDTNHRNKVLTSPTVLNWPGKVCRNISLLIVGPQIKQINLVDSEFNFVEKLKFKLLKNGAYQVDFVMDPESAGTLHTKKDDPDFIENADFYFEIIPTTGVVQYTSVRY